MMAGAVFARVESKLAERRIPLDGPNDERNGRRAARQNDEINAIVRGRDAQRDGAAAGCAEVNHAPVVCTIPMSEFPTPTQFFYFFRIRGNFPLSKMEN